MILAKPNECPVCGYRLDAATGIREEDAKPRPGDYIICMACTTVMRFTEDLGVRVATEEDMKLIKEEDPESWKVLQEGIKVIREQIVDKNIKLS